VSEQRRHRLIWTAVGCLHLAALAGVVVSGAGRDSGAPAPTGGLILIQLVEEPMGLPGEAKQGPSLGSGTPLVSPVPSVAPVTVRPAASIVRPAGVATTPVAVLAPSAATMGVAVVPEPVFVPPSFRFRSEPVYPERARRAGVEGRATIQLRISATGEVLAAAVAESSGSAALDAAALAAAQASRFAPATAGDRPVAAEASATYRFELR
jgi:protein TonB